MTKTSPIARVLAAAALIGALVLVVVVISSTTGSDDGGKGNKNQVGKKQGSGKKNKPKTKAKTYEVQSGDTLTGIAHKTGISVDKLQTLNPDLDPQALTLGQELKLR